MLGAVLEPVGSCSDAPIASQSEQFLARVAVVPENSLCFTPPSTSVKVL